MKKILINSIKCAILFALVPSVIFASYYFLGVPIYKQGNTDPGTSTCWASSAAMVISYYWGDWTNREVDICKLVYGKYPHQGSTDCSDIVYAINYYTHNGYPNVHYYKDGNTAQGGLSRTAIEYQLGNNGPPIPHIYINGAFHAVVLRGYDSPSDTVYYNDPWDGNFHAKLYNDFMDSGKSWQWKGTVIEY